MKKIKITICSLLLLSLVVCLCACATNSNSSPGNNSTKTEDVPEAVSSLQHKIDKALESEPSYEDWIEIKEEYDDLLKAEQDMITGYDKVAAKFALDRETVACIATAQKLKGMLKNPSTLKITGVEVRKEKIKYIVKLDYSAENNVGGTVEDTYYCSFSDINEEDGKWTYRLDFVFTAFMDFDRQQSNFEDKFKKGDAAGSVDLKMVQDNLNLTLIEGDPL